MFICLQVSNNRQFPLSTYSTPLRLGQLTFLAAACNKVLSSDTSSYVPFSTGIHPRSNNTIMSFVKPPRINFYILLRETHKPRCQHINILRFVPVVFWKLFHKMHIWKMMCPLAPARFLYPDDNYSSSDDNVLVLMRQRENRNLRTVACCLQCNCRCNFRRWLQLTSTFIEIKKNEEN